MSYIFKGKLCGYICRECPEPLAGLKIRLYRTRKDQNVTALAVANPNDTFNILNSNSLKEKESNFFAEAVIDEQGNYHFELGEKQKYNGEPFEVDIYCETVPHLKSSQKKPEPVQFTITVLQPQWKQIGENYVGVWEYCIPWRFWCAIRARFGAWVICGKVTVCKTQMPVAGLKVHAFDADWLQDDELGFGITDGDGKFRIDYSLSDFNKTPFSPLLNLELVGGPDIYFRIEDSGGNVILNEPRSRARQNDRENVGPCFCVSLCVDVESQPPFKNPWFTHVGDFHIITDINSGSGLTNAAVLGHGGPNYAFFGGMKLRGFCPKTSPSGPALPMRYRFRYAPLAMPLALTPITGDKVLPVLVGSRLIQWKLFDDNLVWTFQSIYVQGSGATPDPTPTPGGSGPWGPVPAHVIVPDADGWINVDQNGLDDGFYGSLVRFNSVVAIPGGNAPSNGAGNPVLDPKNGTAIRIVFEAGPVGGAVTFSNELPNVLINNWQEVRLLNLQQFTSGGSCSDLNTDLNILYTTDHQQLASWNIGISSAAVIPPIAPPLPSGTAPRGGFGNRYIDISSWPACSYLVALTTRRALTDGENDDSANTISVTFCKG